jgi:hypothetical protein
MTFSDLPRGRYEIRVFTRDAEHFLARTVDIDQLDIDLADWDISAMPRKQ